ncbi:aldo/keto reductase [Beutenbergia cavernae DSM 12333]|uniref:Aldo/keto reductase n=1 Tax=Beutenbergia cavernae (strain ATCC BAA-8 / DSM 12333 / CCUG 43141 / JCM 11478 / NBRC 16432 / NCIMB 13614 / HKI 0122) TaxID=471853 RepID=C5BYY7_BEUC1|nr:aldo/keto reductase [Beutenbergia cavernae]ACQ81102.1 aldo/keto reductase [Beutenbergia cavernae DSM 12333]
MTSAPIPTVTLRPGVDIPLLGLGTWQATGTDGYDSVRAALDLGYRHVDTARAYGNEDQVGRAVADSGIDRSEVFVTTKLPPEEAGDAPRIIDESLERLGFDYVDLWLVHWPPNKQARPDVWADVVAAQEAGKARAIGVSNYSPAQIDELTAATGVTPSINQIPWSPSDFDADPVAAHRERDVVLEGYSPFKRTNLEDPVLTAIADAHGVTTSQVVLRWHLDTGVVVIPKSVHPDRIAANLDVAGFALDADEVERISGLGG